MVWCDNQLHSRRSEHLPTNHSHQSCTSLSLSYWSSSCTHWLGLLISVSNYANGSTQAVRSTHLSQQWYSIRLKECTFIWSHTIEFHWALCDAVCLSVHGCPQLNYKQYKSLNHSPMKQCLENLILFFIVFCCLLNFKHETCVLKPCSTWTTGFAYITERHCSASDQAV